MALHSLGRAKFLLYIHGMFKIKNKIKQLRKLIRWIPIIWKDRDWDHYFIYEILKQKLIDHEQGIKEGYSADAFKTADKIRTAIRMIEIVQNEEHIEVYLDKNTSYTNEELDNAIDNHDKAKRELFNYLNNNIEEWWD